MSTEALDKAGPAQPISEWLPRWLRLTFAVKRDEHRQWFALIEEFDITGMGRTVEDARDEALSLLGAYLHAQYDDGRAFSDTLRPIPRRLKLEIRFGHLLHLLFGERRAARAANEERALIPPAALNGAAC